MSLSDLPHCERNMSCSCLDANNKWRDLGLKFTFNDLTMNKIQRLAPYSSMKLPMYYLLTEWETQKDGKISTPFGYMYFTNNSQVMEILRPFVDERLCLLIKKEGCFSWRDQQLMPLLTSSSSMKSPMYCSLTKCETQGDGKISTLFGYTHFTNNNSQTMEILRPFVDERLRLLITKGEERLPLLSPYESSKKTSRQNQIEVVAASNSHHQRRSGLGSGDTSTKMNHSLTQSAQVCSFHIQYEELQRGTNNWNKRLVLGQGDFGKVFKGSWKNTKVAIKQLETKKPNTPRKCTDVTRQMDDSLKKELKYLTKYRHDNILPLYGYSIDGEIPCLVYQLMSNGSLQDHLHLGRNRKALSWWTRVTIARGSARGLQFLHSVDDALIHGDIKSANILLDSNFVPKIGDFGLARDGPIKDYTHVELTTIQGTRFYVPAEVLRSKKLSVKADTYAFGVVLCELATGSLAGFYKNKKLFHLRDICHEAAAKNLLSSLKDLKVGNRDEKLYDDLIKLGIKCTSEIPRKRPLMADVLAELNTIVKLRKGRRSTPPEAPEPIHADDTDGNTQFCRFTNNFLENYFSDNFQKIG